MSPRIRLLTAAAAVATAAFAGMPARAAGAAESPCRAVVSQSTGSETAILLEGHYSYSGPDAGISDTQLTCYIVQNGAKVVAVSDQLEGPTAALVSDERIDPHPFTICYSVVVVRRLGPQPEDIPSASDC